MEDLLHRFGLIDELQLSFEMEKQEFIELLEEEVEEKKLGPFSDFGDLMGGSKKAFKGELSRNGFKIRKRRKFFEPHTNTATAIGKYSQMGRNLQVDILIQGLRPEMKFVLGLFSLGLAVGLFFLFRLSELNPIVGLVLVIQFFLVFLIMGFVARLGVKTMKKELEREIVYLMAKSGHSFDQDSFFDESEEKLQLNRLKRKA